MTSPAPDQTGTPQAGTTPDRDRTLLRLARTSLAICLAGMLVAVVIAIVSLVTTEEDADLGMVSAFLVAVPLLLPLVLSAGALRLRRSASPAAFPLAVAAAGLLALGALLLAGIFGPSVLG